MALIGTKKGAPIEDRAALAAFIDAEAETFARGAVDGYTRARVYVDVDADAALAQPELAAAIATACGEAFPIAFILVAQTVESALAAKGRARAAQLAGLVEVAQTAFDGHARPPTMTTSAWDAARGEVVRWLGETANYPPRTTNTIVDQFVGPMLALMPIHDELGRDDYPLLRNAMHIALAAVAARFAASAVLPLLTQSLARRDS